MVIPVTLPETNMAPEKEAFPIGKSSSNPRFVSGRVHTGKLTWNLKTAGCIYCRCFSFSNRIFSGSMLVFGGVFECSSLYLAQNLLES